MAEGRAEILQGTLDLMVLKTLEVMGPLHGYGIARRIEQISEEALLINARPSTPETRSLGAYEVVFGIPPKAEVETVAKRAARHDLLRVAFLAAD